MTVTPLTPAGLFHETSPGRQNQTAYSDWVAIVVKFQAIAAHLQLEGDERALEQVAKATATISIMEQCNISDALLIRCLYFIFTRSSRQYQQYELATLFCDYEDEIALKLAWGQAGMIQKPSQHAGADEAIVFLWSPESDAAYVDYTASNTEYRRGESLTEQLAASIHPAFRTIRRRPTRPDTAAGEDSDLRSLSPADEPFGRQERKCDSAQCAPSEGASAEVGNDAEGDNLPPGLQDHHDGLRKAPAVTGKPERPRSPTVIIRGAADGARRSAKAPIDAADGTAAQVASTVPRPQHQPQGDHPQKSLSFTPPYSAPADEHQRSIAVDFSKATAHISQAPRSYLSDTRHLAASDDFEIETAHGCQNSQDRTVPGCQSSPNFPTPLVMTDDSSAGLGIQHGRDGRASGTDHSLAAGNAFPLADVPIRTRTKAFFTTRRLELRLSQGDWRVAPLHQRESTQHSGDTLCRRVR